MHYTMTLHHPFICPFCQLPLERAGHTVVCANAHTFDIAREGYVNLLRKKQSGDTKEMLLARRQFLEQGYYQPLSDWLNELVYAHLACSAPYVLDAGCGEGYYLGRLQHFWSQRWMAKQAETNKDCNLLYGLPGSANAAQDAGDLSLPHKGKDRPAPGYFAGTDISKEAIKLAARRYRACCFVVSNLKERCVVADGVLNLLLNIFAPHNVEEFARVMVPGGLLVLVIPGPSHLLQVRQRLHLLNVEEQKQQHVTEQFAHRFELLTTTTLRYTLHLANAALAWLVMMTPNFWHLSSEIRLQLAAIDELQTEVEFIGMLWRRK